MRFICVLVCMCALCKSGWGQPDLNRSEKALAIINSFAQSMCADPAFKGSATQSAAEIKAGVELNNLIKTLADAKVEVKAGIKDTRFQGLLQKDLLDATKVASSCRLTIYQDLVGRLLPQATTAPSPGASERLPAAGGAQRQPAPAPKSKGVSFLPAVQLGDTKAQLIEKLGGNLTWSMSTDAVSLEYTKFRADIAQVNTDVYIFLKHGVVDIIKAELELESYRSVVNNVGNSLDDVNRTKGVSIQTYRRECPATIAKITSLVQSRQSPSKYLPQTLDERGEVERELGGYKSTISVAQAKVVNSVFDATPNLAKITLYTHDRQREYEWTKYWSAGGAVHSKLSITSGHCFVRLRASYADNS